MGPVFPVVAVVFYDENGNGRLDAGEDTRVPDVTVEIAGRTGRSEKVTGRTVVDGVPAGTQTVGVRAGTTPPSYTFVGASPTTPVPQPSGADVYLPLTLPIGSNRPNVYMAFGDSITAGDGSSDGRGYLAPLEALLRAHFGRAFLVNQGLQGSRSNRGADRIGGSLDRTRPAYTLILYGTNDWNEPVCKEQFPCYTIDSLRSMIVSAKSAQSIPVMATLIPGNPSMPDRVPPERNDWIARMNDLIRPMARQEGAILADLHQAFLREPSLPPLFSDHIHPNDQGYDVMAREFFRAITTPPTGASGSSGLEPLFTAPGVAAPPAPGSAPGRGPGRRREAGRERES